jgi:hypothetical protein
VPPVRRARLTREPKTADHVMTEMAARQMTQPRSLRSIPDEFHWHPDLPPPYRRVAAWPEEYGMEYRTVTAYDHSPQLDAAEQRSPCSPLRHLAASRIGARRTFNPTSPSVLRSCPISGQTLYISCDAPDGCAPPTLHGRTQTLIRQDAANTPERMPPGTYEGCTKGAREHKTKTFSVTREARKRAWSH